MLYHFPTREALVEAAVAHIQAERMAALTQAGAALPAGADPTEHTIDAYWRLLATPPFVAFAELEAIARTDPEIARAVAVAQAEFDQAESRDEQLALLQAGQGPRFQASRDLARFLLEGLARARLTHDGDGRQERLLAVIKRATHMLNRKGAVEDLWED
jgi:AcrR family transcriptional regulator